MRIIIGLMLINLVVVNDCEFYNTYKNKTNLSGCGDVYRNGKKGGFDMWVNRKTHEIAGMLLEFGVKLSMWIICSIVSRNK